MENIYGEKNNKKADDTIKSDIKDNQGHPGEKKDFNKMDNEKSMNITGDCFDGDELVDINSTIDSDMSEPESDEEISESEQCFYASFKIYLSPPPQSMRTPGGLSSSQDLDEDQTELLSVSTSKSSTPMRINQPLYGQTQHIENLPTMTSAVLSSSKNPLPKPKALPPPPMCRPPPLFISPIVSPSFTDFCYPKSCPAQIITSFPAFPTNQQSSDDNSGSVSSIKNEEKHTITESSSHQQIFDLNIESGDDEPQDNPKRATADTNYDCESNKDETESNDDDEEPTLSLCVPENNNVIENNFPEAKLTKQLCTSDEDISTEHDLEFDHDDNAKRPSNKNNHELENSREKRESPVFFLDPLDWIKTEGNSPIPTINSGLVGPSFPTCSRSLLNSPIPFLTFASHGSDLDTLAEEEVSEKDNVSEGNLFVPSFTEESSNTLPVYSPLRRASMDYRSRSMTPNPDIRQRKITIPIVSKRNTFMVGVSFDLNSISILKSIFKKKT